MDGINASCGDTITLYLKVNEGKISDISFTGESCMLSQISAELLCEKLSGLDIEQVSNLSDEDFFKEIDIHPSPGRVKCMQLPLKTVNNMLSKISIDPTKYYEIP